jgi:HlyD family secretion protein
VLRGELLKALTLCVMAVLAVPANAAETKSDAQIGGTGRVVPGNGVLLLRGIPGAPIAAVYVHAGDAVKKGDPLVAFDDAAAKADASVAALDVETAGKLADQRIAVETLAVRLAEQKLQRAQQEAASYRAIGAGGTSDREVTRLAAAVDETRLGLELEKAKELQVHTETDSAARQAQLRYEAAKAKLAKYVLRAPADGVVLRLDRAVGEDAADEPVLQFADLSTMFVICQIYEGDMLKLKRGMKATIKSVGIADLGGGTVDQVGQLIDTRSQLGEVRIRLDHPDPADRLVGMAVEVVISP